ncbi:N-acetyltransferase family protein [Mesobacillus sp. LC4]
MKLSSRKMTKESAIDVLNWYYEPPYDLYNNVVTDEAISELLNEGYTAVVDGREELIGFYCSGQAAQVPALKESGAYSKPAVDVGVGLHPKLTGQGYGIVFLSFILNELEGLNPDSTFRLTVAKFNKRAIRLYENMGFKIECEFKTENNEFFTMVKW